MRRPALTLITAGLGIIAACPAAVAGPGLPTRNLNPILQPIFLPGYFNPGKGEGWRFEHSLYVSNSFQQEIGSTENLIIDVEHYRYELGLQYRRGNWVLQARLPFSANQGGELDSLIESWHGIFGLPDGNRGSVPHDEISIEYRRNGVVEYSQTESSSGFNDMSVAIGYRPPGRIAYFLGVELPTGSSSDFTGNDSVDVALWLLGDVPISPKISLSGLFGVSFPADNGALEGLLADEIWVAQVGLSYRFTQRIAGFAQLDAHSRSIVGSELEAFGNSMQIQLGLSFDDWLRNHRVELFFSEDIDVGTAPDISFGLRMIQNF